MQDRLLPLNEVMARLGIKVGRAYFLALCRSGRLPLSPIKVLRSAEPLISEAEVTALLDRQARETREVAS